MITPAIAGRAEVLDADDQAAREELEAALDQQLLGERVPYLDAGPLRGIRASTPNVALASTEAPPTPSGQVVDPNRITLLPGPLAAATCRSPCRIDPHAERVDQRITRVARVEVEFAADVGQAQAVRVDAGEPQ